MKILVLGANGMLGHVLFKYLSQYHFVYGSVRHRTKEFRKYIGNQLNTIYSNIEIENIELLIDEIRPDVVINCIGIIKQKNQNDIYKVNAEFPHQLKITTTERQIRLIHISTDCVFDGKKGNYNENGIPFPIDPYGASKELGELRCGQCLTIRTSIIGPELNSKYGLFEWFLNQNKCKGFKKAIFSGLTTLELSKIINTIIEYKKLTGLYHVAGDSINKFDLLNIIKNVYGLNTEIETDELFEINRSLDASEFNNIIGYKPPSWQSMIQEMKDRG